MSDDKTETIEIEFQWRVSCGMRIAGDIWSNPVAVQMLAGSPMGVNPDRLPTVIAQASLGTADVIIALACEHESLAKKSEPEPSGPTLVS